MFSEVLLRSLIPILGNQYTPEECQSLASYIAESLEINPREGNNIPFLRDSILKYLNHPQTVESANKLKVSRLDAASKLQDISVGISQLGKLSAKSLKSQLLADPHDQTLANDIYNLNFGYKQSLGEILFQVKHNQGGKLGF
jgi:hypothetical protein